MNSIEMSDGDGDALTVISRDHRTWITCTSGADEVTVGPFSTRSLRGALLPAIAEGGQVTATVISRSAAPQPVSELPAAARDRAWAAFTRQAETSSLREALDGALETALSEVAQPDAADAAKRSELARALQQVSITIEDAGALADHLVSLGYRKD